MYNYVLSVIYFFVFRMAGEDAEASFCSNKSLNMPILRMTWEAKNQIRDILVNADFPEECLLPFNFNVSGTDSGLDLVS